VIGFQILALPAVAALSAFGLILAFPQRSAATRIVEELDRRSNGGAAQALTERVVDARNLGKLRAKFLAAGWFDVTPSAFLTRCAAYAAAGAIVALAAGWMLHFAQGFIACAVAVGVAGGGHIPFSQLNGAVKRRAREISRALPDLLDTLASTVRAGLAPNAALAHAANAVQGALADEIRATLSEIRLGRSRADALRSLGARVDNEEIKLMVRAMVQAERLGANLSAVLTGLSEESRERRVLKAEEIAASLPVKMVLPMAFLMLPALFIMIFGAVAADYFVGRS
jgi:tight adherence protein C